MVSNVVSGIPCPLKKGGCGQDRESSIMRYDYATEEDEQRHDAIAVLLHCMSCEHTWLEELRPSWGRQ